MLSSPMFLPRAFRFTPRSLKRFYSSTIQAELAGLRKTPLFNLHVANGAQMMPFAGYAMPVTYTGQSIGESHNWVRQKAGLFDVSHMVQHSYLPPPRDTPQKCQTWLTIITSLTGPGALHFLQSVTPTDVASLPTHHYTLSVFLHPLTGGIVDDLIITSHGPESFYIVTNAGCREKDLAYIAEKLKPFPNAAHKVLGGQGLLALQGPLAKDILGEYLAGVTGHGVDLPGLLFGHSMFIDTPALGEGERLHIARGGYTGEDGFEISVSGEKTEAVATGLLAVGHDGDRLRLAGLGARDSLRLEAGMCLYGHDLNDETTPVEAGLKWLIGKKRVAEGFVSPEAFSEGFFILIRMVYRNFLGAEKIAEQYADWKRVPRRRVGFIVNGPPAREGAKIVERKTENVIGILPTQSPTYILPHPD